MARHSIEEVPSAVLANRPGRIARIAVSVLIVLWLSPALPAQTETPTSKALTFEQAVNLALKNYPAIRAALEQVSAARGGVDLARIGYLPRADMLWQSNRATRNNIFGLLLPPTIIPPISGPVLPSTSNDSVWGSAAGLLFSWEPFDFGYRHAQVNAARASQNRASAEVSLTRLDVAAAAADAFFTLLAAQERTHAAQADVERRRVLAQSVDVLVDNQLRPGADASRADAELAAARIQLIQAQQAERVSRVALSHALGVAGTEVKIDAGELLESLPQAPMPARAITGHPLAAVEKSRIDEATARLRVLARQYFPRFNFQSGISGRGSGAAVDGRVAGGANGLGLERYNWAVGMTFTFPLFDLSSIHARRHIEASNERIDAARYDQAIQDLTGQLEKARAALEGARLVAENTPIQLRAARDTEAQSRARYQAGLATMVEVADAQRLLVQAEIDDSLAKLSVWRGLAFLAAAQGDIQAFMQLLSKPTPGGP